MVQYSRSKTEVEQGLATFLSVFLSYVHYFLLYRDALYDWKIDKKSKAENMFSVHKLVRQKFGPFYNLSSSHNLLLVVECIEGGNFRRTGFLVKYIRTQGRISRLQQGCRYREDKGDFQNFLRACILLIIFSMKKKEYIPSQNVFGKRVQQA